MTQPTTTSFEELYNEVHEHELKLKTAKLALDRLYRLHVQTCEDPEFLEAYEHYQAASEVNALGQASHACVRALDKEAERLAPDFEFELLEIEEQQTA